MAEYYAVLTKAVAGLDDKAPDARRAVYDKARNALIGQLKAIDPPLPTAEISRQRLELEEAIRRVEREAATGQPAPPPRAVGTMSASASVAAATVEMGHNTAVDPAVSVNSGRRSPQEVFRRAIQDAESRGFSPSPQANSPTPAPPTIERARPAIEPAPMPAERTAPPPIKRVPPPPRAAETGASSRDDSRGAERFDREMQERRPPPVRAEMPRRQAEPQLAPDYGHEWEGEHTPPQRVPPEQDDYVDRYERSAPSRGAWAQSSTDDRDVLEARAARPSRLPTLMLLGLILAVAVGVGALGWSQRDIISEILASFDGGGGETPIAATTAGPDADSGTNPVPSPDLAVAPADADPGKATDRLLPGAGQPGVRVVQPGPTPATTPDSGATVPVTTGTAGVTGGPERDVAALAAPGGPAVDVDALVAQKAVLYEEPTDPSAAANGVIAIQAAATWSYLDDSVDGPQVSANIDVPGRGMTVRLTIRKNNDSTLPASHLVEILIDTPGDFPGQGIDSVPRLVLKTSEQAQGQPLIGATATITNGFYWIALSGAEADVTANLGLLANLGWIDVPMVYATGQRAILTIEKGTPGERVFARALAAWAEGSSGQVATSP